MKLEKYEEQDKGDRGLFKLNMTDCYLVNQDELMALWGKSNFLQDTSGDIKSSISTYAADYQKDPAAVKFAWTQKSISASRRTWFSSEAISGTGLNQQITSFLVLLSHKSALKTLLSKLEDDFITFQKDYITSDENASKIGSFDFKEWYVAGVSKRRAISSYKLFNASTHEQVEKLRIDSRIVAFPKMDSCSAQKDYPRGARYGSEETAW